MSGWGPTLPVVGADVNVAQNVAFYIVAAMMVYGALRVVITKNVVHAALWLVIVLGGAAALYILGAAEFVGISQVMVYIGAVMVLFLFGIMLTQAKLGEDPAVNNRGWQLGIPVGVGLLAVLVYAIYDLGDATILPDPDAAQLDAATPMIADAYLGRYLIPLLALSFVLLAAAIGAIVLARKD